MIYDDGFMLDRNGRAVECPNCHNEEIDPDAIYCKICGSYLINKCCEEGEYGNNYSEGCGSIVSGNARFCPSCGNNTTFYKNGFLKKWEDVKETIMERNNKQKLQLEEIDIAETNDIEYMEVLNWDEIISGLKEINRLALYTCLIETKAYKSTIDYDSSIYIGFNNSQEFGKALVSKAENKSVLEDIIQKKFNLKYKIECCDLSMLKKQIVNR